MGVSLSCLRNCLCCEDARDHQFEFGLMTPITPDVIPAPLGKEILNDVVDSSISSGSQTTIYKVSSLPSLNDSSQEMHFVSNKSASFLSLTSQNIPVVADSSNRYIRKVCVTVSLEKIPEYDENSVPSGSQYSSNSCLLPIQNQHVTPDIQRKLKKPPRSVQKSKPKVPGTFGKNKMIKNDVEKKLKLKFSAEDREILNRVITGNPYRSLEILMHQMLQDPQNEFVNLNQNGMGSMKEFIKSMLQENEFNHLLPELTNYGTEVEKKNYQNENLPKPDQLSIEQGEAIFINTNTTVCKKSNDFIDTSDSNDDRSEIESKLVPKHADEKAYWEIYKKINEMFLDDWIEDGAASDVESFISVSPISSGYQTPEEDQF